VGRPALAGRRTLWRASQNVLTLLDGNIFDDLFSAYDAAVFRDRVLQWLAEDVTPLSPAAMHASLGGSATDRGVNVIVNPKPSTLLLLGVGLLAAVGAGRRRARAA
jgi:hypothetical protein